MFPHEPSKVLTDSGTRDLTIETLKNSGYGSGESKGSRKNGATQDKQQIEYDLPFK